MTQICPVEDSSRVAEVRRAATVLAREEGLDESQTGTIALIATEVGTNLLKHARGGEVCLSALSERGVPGVELLAIDRGPGMQDVDRCLSDGYSSTSTSGTGLGSVVRLAQDFDIYSEPGKGTVLLAQVRAKPIAGPQIGAIVKPLAGEYVSGDAWACCEGDGFLTVMLADGLGHGVMAAQASAEAVAAFRRCTDPSPEKVLDEVHRALRSTRGAAVAVMQLIAPNGAIKFAGIGNVAGVISAAGRSQFMISHAGTAGYGSPKIQVFSYAAPEGALIVMHSDGLTTSWSIDNHVGLRKHHPAVIAGVLYRDASRSRDDTCVVVVTSENRA